MFKKKEHDSFKEFATSTVKNGIAFGQVGVILGGIVDTIIHCTDAGEARFERYGISGISRSTRKMGKAGFAIGALIGANASVNSWAEKEKAKQQALTQEEERTPGS
jgi:hypothetical protein